MEKGALAPCTTNGTARIRVKMVSEFERVESELAESKLNSTVY